MMLHYTHEYLSFVKDMILNHIIFFLYPFSFLCWRYIIAQYSTMSSWTLTPTQNAIILEITKILLSNLILYLLLTFWWFLGDYDSKVWTDTYITEQIRRIIPYQRSDEYKRLWSIISRLIYLGSLILTAFFVTIMTKLTTSPTSVQYDSPVSLIVTERFNETIPSFSLQALEASNMSFPLAMCRLYRSCSTEDHPSGIGEQTYYSPSGDNVSFIPASQPLLTNIIPPTVNGTYVSNYVGFDWNLASFNPEYSTVCMRGVGLHPNSTSRPDNNTLFMEYSDSLATSPIAGIDATVTGDLGCYLYKFIVKRNTNNRDSLWSSSATLASGISIMSDVAIVSSEIFPAVDTNGRALRLDIVATQQAFITFTPDRVPYAGTSKYMSAECSVLLKSLYTSDKSFKNNRTAKLYLKRQPDESVAMDACSISLSGHYFKFYWVHVIVSTSWTETGYSKHNASVKTVGLPGIGGVTMKGNEGDFPVSNLMLFDYTIVPQQTGDLNSTSLARLDETLDKYLQSLQMIHYNNDTVWGIRMGIFEMTALQYSMVGATLIKLPYVIIVVALGSLGILATLLKNTLLDRYYYDSFPINIARAAEYQRKDGDSDNSINEAEYSLVQLDPSTDKNFFIQLNNRILYAECYSSMSLESLQKQSLLDPSIEK
jgi:hypothetical protein